MSKVDAFETDILQLIFENEDLAAIGDGTGLQGSSTPGSFYIALFTADPTDTGSVAAETVYTNYARVAVARSTAAWTVTNDECVNDAVITFAQCGATGATITHFGIMKAGTRDVADMIYHGQLTASRVLSNGITPEYAAGDLTITEG